MSVSLPTWTHKPLSLKVNNVFQFWINQNKHNRNYPSHSWMYVTSWRTKHEKVVKYSFPVAFRDNTNKNEFTHCFITCSVQMTRLSCLCGPVSQKLPNDRSSEYTSFSLPILCETEPQTIGRVSRISSHWNYTNELFHEKSPYPWFVFLSSAVNFGAELSVNKLKSDLLW